MYRLKGYTTYKTGYGTHAWTSAFEVVLPELKKLDTISLKILKGLSRFHLYKENNSILIQHDSLEDKFIRSIRIGPSSVGFNKPDLKFHLDEDILFTLDNLMSVIDKRLVLFTLIPDRGLIGPRMGKIVRECFAEFVKGGKQ